jgi:serine/tyrosine/threonine adenylyltransferase
MPGSTQSPYRPANAINEIGDFIGDSVKAASFSSHILRFRNDRAAAEIGICDLSDEQWIDHFGRFQPLKGTLPQPLALRYHGHQFRIYNPDIGDGRGFLFAQLYDGQGRLLDLGTKGSGQTPYSRFGDGRLTLKGAVREVLATEMLEALGVETSRTLSVIETGEALHRGDEPSPTRSAVLVRMSHGHIRIGSFQRLANLGLHGELERLSRYALHRYWGVEKGDAVRLLEMVVEQTARLAASYMAAGFVHGVLNTDNINITGESFDYGPWRFTPDFDGGFVAAYFDAAGLYAFGRQAEAIHWNLAQLASALRPIVDANALITAVDRFSDAYHGALADQFAWRLGVEPCNADAGLELVKAIEQHLTETHSKIDDFFFEAVAKKRWSLAVPLENYRPIIDRSDPYWQRPRPCTMLIEDVEAIWAPIAEHNDWSVFNAKITAIRQMGHALAKRASPQRDNVDDG